MISKDSLTIFNIVIDLNISNMKNNMILDSDSVYVFWDASSDLAMDVLHYGFVVESLDYHEYDPSMLCIIKSHMHSDLNRKVEFRFRASDSTESVFSDSTFQQYWRSGFDESSLQGRIPTRLTNYSVSVNGKSFEDIYSASSFIYKELHEMSNIFVEFNEIPENLYNVFDS